MTDVTDLLRRAAIAELRLHQAALAAATEGDRLRCPSFTQMGDGLNGSARLIGELADALRLACAR